MSVLRHQTRSNNRPRNTSAKGGAVLVTRTACKNAMQKKRLYPDQANMPLNKTVKPSYAIFKRACQ